MTEAQKLSLFDGEGRNDRIEGAVNVVTAADALLFAVAHTGRPFVPISLDDRLVEVFEYGRPSR